MPARRRPLLHPGGLLIGTALGALALTPSLVPRTGVLQGLVSGVMLAAGYLVGVLLGLPDPQLSDWVLAFPVALGVLVVLLALARGVRALPRWPRRALGVVALVVVAAVAVSLAGIPGVNPARTVLDGAFSGQNEGVFGGAVRPSDPLRSGSPASLVSWEGLGRGGRTFVTTTPSPIDLARASGHPAVDPIRVYVGLGSSPDARDRAQLAVRELARTGAFSRPVVGVVTTTGTGFADADADADAEAMNALELAWVGTPR